MPIMRKPETTSPTSNNKLTSGTTAFTTTTTLNSQTSTISLYTANKYIDKEVQHDYLLELIYSAQLAPSAKNRQPWRFKIINNEAVIYGANLLVGDLSYLTYIYNMCYIVYCAC